MGNVGTNLTLLIGGGAFGAGALVTDLEIDFMTGSGFTCATSDACDGETGGGALTASSATVLSDFWLKWLSAETASWGSPIW